MTNHPLPAYFQLDRYRVKPVDIVQTYLHCAPGQITPRVILMPSWKVDIFEDLNCEIIPVVDNLVYTIQYRGKMITVIRSGIGAPQTGDMVLALGCTPCRALVSIGSAGGLLSPMKIGDLALPTRAVSGDGFSRYLTEEVYGQDSFLQSAYPDSELFFSLQHTALAACKQEKVELYEGPVFTSDSILGQFARLDRLNRDHQCIAVEMEAAAVFRASEIVKIRAAALLGLSDVCVNHKTLFSGRSTREIDRYRLLRRRVLVTSVLEVLYHFEI